MDAALGPDGFGWPMGPLALMDLLGLDVCHHIISYLDAESPSLISVQCARIQPDFHVIVIPLQIIDLAPMNMTRGFRQQYRTSQYFTC